MLIAFFSVLKNKTKDLRGSRQFGYRLGLPHASEDPAVASGLCVSVSGVNIIGLMYQMSQRLFFCAQAVGIQ